jgi:hypothetical protein
MCSETLGTGMRVKFLTPRYPSASDNSFVHVFKHARVFRNIRLHVEASHYAFFGF